MRSASFGRNRKLVTVLSVLAISAGLSACTVNPQMEAPTARASSAAISMPLNDPSTGLSLPALPRESILGNSLMARDFMELGFQLESGRPLARFTRFEGPITISLAGPAPGQAGQDLSQLVSRLRNEAGIAISTGTGAGNHITVEFVPKRQLRAAVPNVACFVVPNVSSFAEYKAERRSGLTDWTRVTQRRTAAVFVPAQAAPQEIRDCLHEEVSQALGPLNDSYRLPDTVWNDDNFNSVLTRHDMTILRAWYDPALQSGMSQPEVLSALPGVLSRVNPAGGSVTRLIEDKTPNSFTNAVSRAMSAGSTRSRQSAAQQAIQIAAAQGWTDSRAGFANFIMGRLTLNSDPSTALRSFLKAAEYYSATPGAYMQSAHVDMQLATFALASGRSDQALSLTQRALRPALRTKDAALMSTLYMIRAEAFGQQGNQGQAAQARVDSQNWARYGFGSDTVAQSRAAEVAALARAGSRRLN
ncbi:ATP-dependent transcriptional regulator [Thioclava sp. SK-1]|nr:ATP-dependent transcriptional regulator [Thioclava sp. SK-1]